MVVDRYGSPIRVGWPAHHLVWLRAAMTLDGQERRDAYQDLAELTGRSWRSIWAQARLLEAQDARALRRARLAGKAAAWVG